MEPGTESTRKFASIRKGRRRSVAEIGSDEHVRNLNHGVHLYGVLSTARATNDRWILSEARIAEASGAREFSAHAGDLPHGARGCR
jgi:hypothetical protein